MVNQDRLRVRIDVSYIGTDFHGWQFQPTFRSVQGELMKMVARLLGRPEAVVGAGRTDAGVHARGQVAHVGVNTLDEAERLMRALPRTAPKDIGINQVSLVSPDFHACVSATARRYSYHIFRGRDIFRPFAFKVWQTMDRAAMDQGAADLLGRHNFSSFCKRSSLRDDGNESDVQLCRFDWTEDSAIFHVRANRFLHHMVRIMVGTLLEIGNGDRPADDIPRILTACERGQAGRMAPPDGLFLENVYYPECLMDPSYRRPREPQDATPVGDDQADSVSTSPLEGDSQ